MKILRNMLSVLLVVVMVVTTVYSAVLLTVRVTVTENLVREVAENLNYAALPLPDGDENGGTTTITEVLNSSLSSLDITMTENEVNDALRSFSVNKIMSETREWLLGDGAEPTISSAKIAKTVAANMPENLSGLLSIFGNPEEVLAEMLSEYTSQLDLHEYFAKLEPYRPFLSEGALFLALSAVLLIVMLVLVCQKLRVVPWLVSVGLGIFLSGACAIFLRYYLSDVRELFVSPVYEVAAPVLAALFRNAIILTAGGLAVSVVSAVAGALVSAIRKAGAGN